MGCLIYKTKGNLGKENFVITAVDVLLMAKGHAAEVGYTADIEMMTDLMDLGLEEYQRGLIHSHNNMGTGFSGTDTNQLQLAATSLPYYLSVVTNNRLEFTAKVAIKSTLELTGYNWFRDLSNKIIKTPKQIKQESFEIIELEVILQKPDYMIQVDERIAAKIQNYTTHVGGKGGIGGNNTHSGKGHQTNNTKRTHTASKKHQEDFDLFTSPIGDGYDYGDFIKAVLDKYCKPDGVLLAADECALNIIHDEEHSGIGVENFIEYLTKYNTFGLNIDKAIIAELKRHTSVPATTD